MKTKAALIIFVAVLLGVVAINVSLAEARDMGRQPGVTGQKTQPRPQPGDRLGRPDIPGRRIHPGDTIRPRGLSPRPLHIVPRPRPDRFAPRPIGPAGVVHRPVGLAVRRCPPGTVWVIRLRRCLRPIRPCPPGTLWSPLLKRCIRRFVRLCPPGTHWNPVLRRCGVPMVRPCPPGTVWNPRLRRCIRRLVRRCPPGLFWHPRVRRCVRRLRSVGFLPRRPLLPPQQMGPHRPPRPLFGGRRPTPSDRGNNAPVNPGRLGTLPHRR